jgi:Uma2 family endonuclease
MADLANREEAEYTYEDMLHWDESFHAEINDGALFVMDPPGTYHQGIAAELTYQLKHFLKGKEAKVYPGPFGVRLFPKEDLSDTTVLEPDITVVCDPAKLDKRGCNGAPDLIIEILSPANTRHDLVYKFNKYLKAGVREYWTVDPESHSVQVHILDQSPGAAPRYITSLYELECPEPVPVSVLPGCMIDIKAVFAE